MLAHAYYPESGLAHFDDAETYTDGTDEYVLLSVNK